MTGQGEGDGRVPVGHRGAAALAPGFPEERDLVERFTRTLPD